MNPSLSFAYSSCKSNEHQNALFSEEHIFEEIAPQNISIPTSPRRCGLLARLLHVSRRHTMNKVLGSWNVSRVHGSDLPLSGAGKGCSFQGLYLLLLRAVSFRLLSTLADFSARFLRQ